MPAPNDHLAKGERFDATAGGAPNLTACWLRHWQADPDRPQIHDPRRGWITRGQLEADTARRAGRLARLGLVAGDRVLVAAASSADLVASHVACLRMGLVVVPTNTAYGPRELQHVVRDAEPRAAIVDDDARRAALAEIDPSLACLEPALDLPDGPTPALERVDRSAMALLCYTSGTTGQPKGAVLRHGHCLASAEGLRHAWRWNDRDRLLLCLPLFHMHGLGVGLHGTLHTGGSAVLFEGFRPDELLAAIEPFAATLFFGVPTMYHRLADHPDAARLSKLRLCVSGSAPLPAALHAALQKASGQRILERYGMTETLMLVSNPHDGERRAGTVGLPLPGVELRVHLDERGDSDERGEIEVRGPNVFDGYWRRPEANAEAFTPDGFFRTGDLGRIEADGYLTLDGRAKELIISGGYNVYPRELEDVLRAHPAIEDIAIVGEKSEEWGERVAAYAVLKAPLELEALRRWIGDQLAAFKHPRALYGVEALPRNALGKVQKHRLMRGGVRPE